MKLRRESHSLSSLLEHGVSDEAIAEVVNGNNQVVVVASEETQVDREVGVPNLKHVLEVLDQFVVIQVGLLHLVQIQQSVPFLQTQLRLFLFFLLVLLDLFLRFLFDLGEAEFLGGRHIPFLNRLVNLLELLFHFDLHRFYLLLLLFALVEQTGFLLLNLRLLQVFA